MKMLAAITLRAREKGLELLLAGGHAVIVHGYQRTTFDTDLIIRRSNREAWLELMRNLRFEMFHEGPAFLQFNPPQGERTPIDLMLTNDQTFTKLLAEALPNPENAANPGVISLRHLIAMKCHAIRHGHAGRIVKDMDDVIHLFKIHRLDPFQSEWRELILKYGTEEFLKQLQRFCQE